MYETQKEYYGEEQKNYVISLVKDQGISALQATRAMCEHFNLVCKETVERNYRSIISKLKPDKIEDEEFKRAQSRQFDDSKQRFIVSWAQSETPIHEQFLKNIEAYAEFIEAEIHIICGKYKNPTSLEASKREEKKDKNKNYWDAKLFPYLSANRQNIHKYLTILGDLKISPTASTPLSGLNGVTALESCILGHPRVHLKSLPVLDGYPNKLLVSTGAITLPNYTDTKAGKKGDFHHALGFVIVELDGEDFHIRQVQCNSEGMFYDLIYKVEDGKTSISNDTYPAIVLGDIHYGDHSPEDLKLSLGMARTFKAENVVLHDIFDGKSTNHHEINNPFRQLENEQTGRGDLKKEIENIISFVQENEDLNFVVVRSNHDDFLDRWLINSDWRKQPNRAEFLRLAGILASGNAVKGAIPHELDANCSNVVTLGINDSYRVCGWELGIHGHLGANGSRGGIIQYKGLNTKTITGHVHTPQREDGSLSVGMLTNFRLGYNNSLSSWMRGNAIVYPTGKASHIHITNNKYTTLY